MHNVELKRDIFWVGAVDWNIRDFHGYSTYKGTTYNAFLVLDDKVTLFDTVKRPFKADLLRHIAQVVDPGKVDYLVVNHVEMDHSSCVPDIVEICRPEKIICSSRGKQALLDHYHREDWPYEVVESGQSLSLGRRTVRFLETRMLHWPDSMFSYLQEDRLLISSDAFGQHWATSERFEDEVDPGELMAHAAKYYANILLLYSPLVQKLLSSVKEMNLPIDMIAPDHGLIWRSAPGKILEAYDSWSRQVSGRKALVVYDTMWQSTKKMADAIADGLTQQGVSVQVMDLKATHRSDVMTQILDAKALVFGSPTLNNGMLPSVADMLHYLRGLKPAGKIGTAFGSFGWSGEGMKMVLDSLEQMKVEIVDPGIKVRFVPTEEDLVRCVELGRKVGAAVNERV
jgi:flavorubredoxin